MIRIVCSITLGEAEKGNVSPVEHIGNPSSIKRRMGTDWNETRRTSNVHKDWWKSSYLDERQKYFKDVIDEMDPHKPVNRISICVVFFCIYSHHRMSIRTIANLSCGWLNIVAV